MSDRPQRLVSAAARTAQDRKEAQELLAVLADLCRAVGYPNALARVVAARETAQMTGMTLAALIADAPLWPGQPEAQDGARAGLPQIGPCEVVTVPPEPSAPPTMCGARGVLRRGGTVLCEPCYQTLCVCEWCGGEQAGPGCCTACAQANTPPPTRPTAATISSIAAARAARASRAGEDKHPHDEGPA